MKIDALVINQLTQISQRILDMIERAKDQSESLIDNLPFLFAVITGDGVILRGGDRLSKMYQCQMDDLLGKNISDLFRKPSWKIMQEKIKSARNTDMVVFETSLDYFRPTSPIIQWTIVYDNKLNFYNNSDVYYICGVDVTTTRNYEQQITKIFAGIPLGIFRVNSDLVIEAPISHYTEVLFGRDDMIGKSFHDVVYGAPGVELTAEDSKKVNNINGIIGFDEFVFDCAKDSLINKLKMIINGNERFIGISYEPIVENSEVVSLLVIVDDQTNIEIKKSEYENQKKYEEKIARNIIDIKRIPESLCPFIFKEIEKAILDLEENGFRTLKKDMIFTELHTVKRVIKKSGMSGMMLEIHRYEDMFEKAHSTEEYGSILSDCVDFMRDETDELKKLFSVFRGGTSGSQKDVNPGSIRLDDKLRKILSATAKEAELKKLQQEILQKKSEIKNLEDSVTEKNKKITDQEKINKEQSVINENLMMQNKKEAENHRKITEKIQKEKQENEETLSLQKKELSAKISKLEKIRDEQIEEIRENQKKQQQLEQKNKDLSQIKKELETTLTHEQKKKSESELTVQNLSEKLKENRKELETTQKNNQSLSQKLTSSRESEKLHLRQIEEMASDLQKTESSQRKTMQELKKLQADYTQLTEQQKTTETDRQKKQEELEEASKTIQKQTDEIKTNKENIRDLSRNLEEKKSELSQQENQNKQLKEEQQSLSKELEDSQKNLGESRKQSQSLAESLSSAKQDVTKLKENLVSAEKELINSRIQSDTLRKNLKQMEQKLDASQNMVQEQKTQLQKSQETREKLNNQLKDTQGQLSAMQGEADNLRGQLKETQGQLSAAQGEADNLRGQLKDTQGQLSAAQGEADNLRGQLKDTQGQLGAAQGEADNLRGQLKDTQGQLGAAQGEADKLRGQLKDTQGQLGAAQGEADNLRGQLKDTQGQLGAAQGEADNLRGQMENMKKAMAEADKKIKANETEIAQLNAQIDQSNDLNQKQKDLLAQTEQKNKECQEKESSQQSRIRDLTQQLGDKEQNLDQVQNQSGSLSDTIGDLQKELDKTRNHLTDSGKANQDLQNNLSQLRQQLADRDKIIDDLQKAHTLKAKNPENSRTNPDKLVADVVRELQQKGISVHQNQSNGSLMLSMDESFYFAHDSANLNEVSKNKLNQVIPALMEHITHYIRRGHELKSMTITGHASPVFSGVNQDPSVSGTYPYQYNLRLSQARAVSVRNYILGNKIRSYPSRELLIKKLGVGGMSYSTPIPETPKTQPADLCGAWDCRRSRRVEIEIKWADRP